MKIYDSLSVNEGTHTVEITLQCGKCKGMFRKRFRGNIKGYDALEFDIDDYNAEEIEQWPKENCEITLDDDGYSVTLTDPANGTKLEFDCLDCREFMNMIVAVEIVDYEREDGRKMYDVRIEER